MINRFANYRSERMVLVRLIAADCQHRLVVIDGPQEIGKTYLLSWLQAELRLGDRFVRVDMDRPLEIQSASLTLETIANRLGRDRFPTFDGVVNSQRRIAIAFVREVHVEGDYNNVTATAAETEADKALLVGRQIEALIRDLRSLASPERPIVIAFDGYDAAGSEAYWLRTALVPRLCELDHVRIIVCSRASAHDCGFLDPAPSLSLTLGGVMDAIEWLDVIRADGRLVDAEHPGSYVKAVVDIHRGSPGAMRRWMVTLPKVGSHGHE